MKLEISKTRIDLDDPTAFIISSVHGPVCIVSEDNLQDALDKAADAGLLDVFKVEGEVQETIGGNEVDEYGATVGRLGNYSDPYVLDGMGVEEVDPNDFVLCLSRKTSNAR